MKICLLNMLLLVASGSLGGRQILVQDNSQAGRDGGNDFSLVADGSVADEYGIVMGSSHIEPMLRNNIAGDEWDQEYPDEPWDYVKNREHIYKYWEERVKENGKYENIYTMGKRGKDDEAGSDITVSVLERIFADQRDILKKWVNKDITKVPLVLIPYTEVLGLYNKGLKVPDARVFIIIFSG